MFRLFVLAAAFVCTSIAIVLPRDDDIHLAVSPNCGNFSGPPVDINKGLKSLDYYQTIVAFGDSYTSGGISNGSALQPPILAPPNPNAGGRITNGALWVEHLAAEANATLQDYAVNGSLVDATQYVHVDVGNATDFLTQVNNYIGQTHNSDPETTLYAIFMGMGDYELRDELYVQDFTEVAEAIIYAIMQLNSSPRFARNFLILDNYGRGTTSIAGENYKQALFSGLSNLYTISESKDGMSVAFVDFATVWNGVLGDTPGYEAFGYTSPDACLENDQTMVGACDDPDHTFYWVPGNPSKVTHGLMAEYVKEVLSQCVA